MSHPCRPALWELPFLTTYPCSSTETHSENNQIMESIQQLLSEHPIINLVFSTCFGYTIIFKWRKKPSYPSIFFFKCGRSASVPKASFKMFASYCVLVFPRHLTWCLFLLYSSHASHSTFILPWQPTALIRVIILMIWDSFSSLYFFFFGRKTKTAISTFFSSSWLSFWAQQCFLLDRNPCAQSPAGNHNQ